MAFLLSYAGVTFPLDTPECRDLIADRISLRYLQDMVANENMPNFPSYRTQGLAIPNYGWRPLPRIGQFFYPTGALRWGEFYGVATSDIKDQMVAAAIPAGPAPATKPFVVRADPSSGDGKASGGFTTNMLMLPPRPLADLGSPYQGLWLITLVDERFNFRSKSAGQYHPKYSYPGFTPGTFSWANLLTQLALSLGVTLDQGDISDIYGRPPEDSELYSNYESAAVLLDAAAWNIGKLVIRNLDGTYALRTPLASSVAVTGNRPSPLLSLAGDDLLPLTNKVVQAILPESVTVTFPKFGINQTSSKTGLFADERDSRDPTKTAYGMVYAKVVTLADAGYGNYTGYSGSKVIRDTARAHYAKSSQVIISGDPTNKADLDALAVRLATDYYDFQLTGIDEVYHGIRDWAPEGLHDVIWFYSVDDCWTRAFRKPWNYEVTETQHNLTTGIEIGPSPLVLRGASSQSGTTTNGSPIIVGLITGDLVVGMKVSGVGVPIGATILTIDSPTQITMSANATASGFVSLTFSTVTNPVKNLQNVNVIEFDTSSGLSLVDLGDGGVQVTSAYTTLDVIYKICPITRVITLDTITGTGTLSVTGTININSGGAWNIKSGGTGTVESGGSLTINSGSTFNIKNSTTIDSTGSITLTSGSSLTAQSGSSVICSTGSNVTLNSTTTVGGPVTFNSSSSLTLNSATVNVSSGCTGSVAMNMSGGVWT